MTTPSSPPNRRRRRVVVTVAVLVLGLGWWFWRSTRPDVDMQLLTGRWASSDGPTEYQFKSDGTFRLYDPGLGGMVNGRFTVTGDQLVFLPPQRPPGLAGYKQDLSVAIRWLRGTLPKTEIKELTEETLRMRTPRVKGTVVNEWKDISFRRVY